MIRKLFALVFALMLLGSCALAEGAAATTYVFEDIGMEITMPEEFNIVLIPGMPADDPAFATLGLTKEMVDQLLEESSFHMDAMVLSPLGITHEMTLMCAAMPLLKSMDALVEAGELDNFVEGMKIPYTAQGITVNGYEAVQVGDTTFVVLTLDASAVGYVGLQALAIENFQMYTLNMNCFLGTIQESDALLMAELLSGVKIAK